MHRLFGTDGIRGRALQAPLDRKTVRALGRALVCIAEEAGRRPSFLLGGDTRASTPQLARWLSDGISGAGGELTWAGVLPTPAISRLLLDGEWGGGVVISASHNPACDNGIKVLDGCGAKICLEEELRLEELIPTLDEGGEGVLPPIDRGLIESYRNFVLSTLKSVGVPRPMHLVLDAAHGAASGIAEEIFENLGFHVSSIASSPDGKNINDGVGATKPEMLAAEVLKRGADVGLALDGDADRAILVDEKGRILDGDDILLVWGRALKARGHLAGNRVVATVMSNFGLESAFRENGIELLRCAVGDRSVWEKMQESGSVLGGEQSGHIICSHHGVSGDGLLTGLHVLSLCSEKELSEISGFERLPQTLINVPVRSRVPFEEIPSLQSALRSVRSRLEGRGRVLLRYSGTELLARVMIEGEEETLIRSLAEELADIIRA